MRSYGVLGEARGLGLQDHVCWAYDDANEYAQRAREFLLDGLAQRQQVLLVTTDGDDPAAALLRASEPFAAALRTGAARIAAQTTIYRGDTAIDPDRQVGHYAAATEQALAAGFTGLRVAAEATSLVRTPVRLDAFARYEYLVDRYMVGHPLAALCAYHRGALGAPALAEVACMHPSANSGGSPFQLHASDRLPDGIAVAGELDLAARELFPLALRRTRSRPAGGRLVVDGTGLTFVDHRSLMALADHAARLGIAAVLHTSLAAVPQISELLDIPNLRVEYA